MPQGDTVPRPGGTVQTAIVIPQTTATELEAFLKFVCGPETLPRPMDIEFCVMLYKLSHRYQYSEGYRTAIEDVKFQATWIQKLILGIRERSHDWVKSGLRELFEQDRKLDLKVA
ncbi:hypothetical protein V5O48_017988, partial [Marasmius crinis-equi]